MKIIKAKQSGSERNSYINANRIDTFYATETDGCMETKIYFGDHKCFIDGDKTVSIAHFMSSDDDCGFLDLTVEEKPFKKWNRVELQKQFDEMCGRSNDGEE